MAVPATLLMPIARATSALRRHILQFISWYDYVHNAHLDINCKHFIVCIYTDLFYLVCHIHAIFERFHHSPSRHALLCKTWHLTAIQHNGSIPHQNFNCMQVVPDLHYHSSKNSSHLFKNLQAPNFYPKVTLLVIAASNYWRRFSDPPTSMINGVCLYKECFISWRWSHILSIIVGGFTALKLQVYSKTSKSNLSL